MRIAVDRVHWTVVMVVLSGVAASVLGWQWLLDDRRANLLETLHLVAVDARNAIVRELEEHHAVLENLAHSWIDLGPGTHAQWEFDAHLAMRGLPGIEWVAWLDLETEQVRRATTAAPDSATPYFREVEELGGETGFRREPSDGGCYRVYFPVGTTEMMVASIDLRRALDPVLALTQSQHITIRDSTGVVAAQSRTEAADLPWCLETARIWTAPGLEWVTTHRPSAEIARTDVPSSPHLVLAAGLLISLGMGLLTHQGSVARRVARQLDQTNRALDRRIVEAQGKDRELRALNRELRDLNRDLERRVEQRTRDLEEAVEELRAFNYSVSHDLRSPLGAILNFSGLLEEDYRDRLDAEGLDWLRRITDSAQSALDLLEGLLHLSRAGRHAIERRYLDMSQLFQQALAETIPYHGAIDLETEFEEGLPDAVGDPALVLNVLKNLLSNADKYRDESRKLCVRFRGARHAEGYNVYQVEDNGLGFEERFAERLFGVFERLHKKSGRSGTGIGLAVVARIVRRHGGRVWAESEPGRGSVFSFTLPAAESTSEVA